MGVTKTVTLYDDDGNEIEHKLPATMKVCYDCEGHGYVLNEAMRYHAYTPEEFYDSFDDEFAEQYFKRGGIYDVVCPTCKGKNVIAVINRDLIENGSDESLKKILAEVDEQAEQDAYYEAECAAERRMGC